MNVKKVTKRIWLGRNWWGKVHSRWGSCHSNCMYVGNSRTNHQGKGEIGYHAISDFAPDWYMGLSMALISIFEFAKLTLYGITRYRLSKIKPHPVRERGVMPPPSPVT